jgi:sialic acid synthase SpsE
MSEDNDDCGCNAQPNKEMNEKDFEKIKKNMESTRDSLNKMFDNIQNLNIDFSKFDNLEQEIKKANQFMYSGEFAKSMVDALKNANIDPEKMASFQNSMVPPSSPFAKTETRTPIGWIYVDENGEQRFSMEKPENITSMPVYGD